MVKQQIGGHWVAYYLKWQPVIRLIIVIAAKSYLKELKHRPQNIQVQYQKAYEPYSKVYSKKNKKVIIIIKIY
mgnify:CR=1 FL=1|jgi:hypothetical protein